MFKNDERYWDINLLNKWFAISSIIFLASTIWTFIDDNDDEFKEYQREFRKMQVEIEKEKLKDEWKLIEDDKAQYEEELAKANELFSYQKEELEALENALKELNGRYYKENMDYQAFKGEVDALKYHVEADNAHPSHGPSYQDEYLAALAQLDKLRLIKEESEIEIKAIELKIKDLKSDVKEKNRA